MSNLDEISKIPYIDSKQLNGRTPLLMPMWDGEKWRHWFETADGAILQLNIIDVACSNYISKTAVLSTDIHIPFVQMLWQQLNYKPVIHLINYLQDDIRNIAVSCSKIRFLFDKKDGIDNLILSSYVETELEYIITIARTIFDLTQEIIAFLWNECTFLENPELEKKRKSVKFPKKFSKVVLKQEKIVTASEISNKFSIPSGLAETYEHYAEFFIYLRKMRDAIVHGGVNKANIYCTEKGFCINPNEKILNKMKLDDSRIKYNESLVSLYPWIAHIVFETLDACSNMIISFSKHIRLQPSINPGYHIFIRDYSNKEFIRLLNVRNGHLFWWD